jgi:hypothetical protein
MSPITDLEKGVRVPGAVVNIAVVGVANATAIFTRSVFAQQVGTKSFIPRKLMVRNNNGGNLWLALGTGVGGAFANALPPVRVLNVLDNEWQEFDLPAVELFANMTAFPDALVAGGSVDVQVEVEERG